MKDLKRAISTLLALVMCLGLLCGFAAAEADWNVDYDTMTTLFGEDYYAQLFTDDKEAMLELMDQYGPANLTAAGNRVYDLTRTGDIFVYDVQTREYAYFATVPPMPQMGETPYGKLDAATKEQADKAVWQLIGAVDSDVLYAYCASTGLFGTVDEQGVHWNDTRLDHTGPVKINGSPYYLQSPFVEGNTLYAFYEADHWDGSKDVKITAQLWAFDIESGKFTPAKLPNTYAICPFKEGQALLLRWMSNGRMFLSTYDLEKREMIKEGYLKLPAVPTGDDFFSGAWLVSALGYHRPSDSIAYIASDGMYQSIGGGAIAKKDVDQVNGNFQLGFLLASPGWMMPDGSYLWKQARGLVSATEPSQNGGEDEAAQQFALSTLSEAPEGEISGAQAIALGLEAFRERFHLSDEEIAIMAGGPEDDVVLPDARHSAQYDTEGNIVNVWVIYYFTPQGIHNITLRATDGEVLDILYETGEGGVG